MARPEVRQIVINALNHFDGDRYHLLDWVIMPNHLHVLVTPLGENELSDILHSWKSFTAKQINLLLGRKGTFWQKESFDHIVRSPEALERLICYFLANPANLARGTFALSPGLQTRRDAASTWEPTEKQLQQVEQEQMQAALKPFHNPKLRNTILAARDSFQVIDETTSDTVLRAGFDVTALEKARAMLTSFRQFIEDNKDEIEALKVLYSRPYRAGLRYGQVKELAAAIQKPPHQLHPERLWQAFELVEAASRRFPSDATNATLPGARSEAEDGNAAGRRVYVPKLVDVIALVKHALDPNTPLAPVNITVEERYQQWLADQEKAGAKFTTEQQRWLDAIKDHIANSLSIEQDDFESVPFNQIGGLGRAYELFGDRLGTILEELNETLAA